jgi:hypothetical protein
VSFVIVRGTHRHLLPVIDAREFIHGLIRLTASERHEGPPPVARIPAAGRSQPSSGVQAAYPTVLRWSDKL